MSGACRRGGRRCDAFGRPPVKLARLMGADRALLEAAFEALPGALWLVGPGGRVIGLGGDGAGAPFPDLAGLPDPAGRILGAALRDRVGAAAEAKLHDRPHALRFVPVHLGAHAGVLHIQDLGDIRRLETQLRNAERLSAVGELAAGIAHDFNNLLTAIAGAAEDLQARAHPGELADLAQIRESAARGAALVRQLLAFGRQQTLQPRVFAVNDAVTQSAALLRRLLGSRIDLVLQLEQPGRHVRADPGQLDQVLVNLAVNAAHAMPGGGRLTIATGHRTLVRNLPLGSETVPPGRYATISVADTGTGIPPAVLPHIFEPFYTTRRAAGGTGLGLSTAHGIVRQSGGYLTVESEVKRGTCFTILLPRHEAEAASPRPEPPPAGPPPPRPDPVGPVLLVEDEAPVRRLAKRALERAGWTVLSCADASGALERFADTPEIAAIVSDVIMPGLDGPGLVEKLRVAAPNLPAVLISGYADAASRERLASANIVFLAKPFAMAELVAAVDAARAGRA